MLQIENLYFSIAEKTILHGISTRFAPGKIHGIVGPNGSGKSTLLKNLCRIWEPQIGTILFNDINYRSLSRKELSKIVTLVPQNIHINFPVSVFDVVTMGRNPHVGRFQTLSRHDREVIDHALHATQTYALKDRYINKLSGGECQLAVIACALATEAEIILLDEPTSELDIKHSLTIMELLIRLKEQGKTILVSIHDLNIAKRYCDTISIIHKGRLFFRGSAVEAFSQDNINKVFGVNVAEIKNESVSFLYFSL